MISFDCSLDDSMLITQIAVAVAAVREVEACLVAMDLTACHCNGTPLALEALQVAQEHNPGDFWHDINGITRNINRATGQLDNFFRPRHHRGDDSEHDQTA